MATQAEATEASLCQETRGHRPLHKAERGHVQYSPSRTSILINTPNCFALESVFHRRIFSLSTCISAF
jgi:hypothetical protein